MKIILINLLPNVLTKIKLKNLRNVAVIYYSVDDLYLIFANQS